jgi:hypothetical protein
MSTATSESNDNNTSGKRIRIDPTTFQTSAMNNNNKSSTDPTATMTPTAASVQQIDLHLASLFPQLQPLLAKSAKPYLKLLQQRFKKEQEIRQYQEMIAAIEDPENPNIPHYPRSCNLKFRLSVTSSVLEDAEFQKLQTDTEEYVAQVRLQLTKRILKATEISHRVLDNQINTAFANALFQCTLALVKASDSTPATETAIATEAHTTVNSILDNFPEILQHTNLELAPFQQGYQITHRLDALPTPINLQLALSPARRGTLNSTATSDTFMDDDRADSIGHQLLGTTIPPPIHRETPRQHRTKKQTQIINTKNLLCSLFIRPFEIYCARMNELDKAAALKKLETELFTSKATQDATMLVDGQPTPTSEQLEQLISKSVAKATAQMKNEISKLQKELESSNKNNNNTNNNNNKKPTRSRPQTKGMRGRSRSQQRSPSQNRTGASTKRKTSSRTTTDKPRRRNNNNNNNRRNTKRSPSRNTTDKAEGRTNDSDAANRNSRTRRSRSTQRSKRNNSSDRTSSNRQRPQSNRN